MRTYSFEPTLWRPYLPNKPVRVEGAHVEGTTNFVTYQYSAESGTITTGFELSMTKHKEGDEYSFDVLGTLDKDLPFSWRQRWGKIEATLDQLSFPIVTTPKDTAPKKEVIPPTNPNAGISMAELLAGIDILEGEWVSPLEKK